jgi:hypothetical protein
VEEKTKPRKSGAEKHKRKSLLVVSAVVAVVVCALATTTVLLYKQVRDLRDDPGKVVTEQAQQLKNTVAKIMHLPDEVPTIATITGTDIDQLKTQAFFKDIKEGDKVLIFKNAQKAVIYRESENRIINSGPVVININASNFAGPDAAAEE